jgi:hypothetical protein
LAIPEKQSVFIGEYVDRSARRAIRILGIIGIHTVKPRSISVVASAASIGIAIDLSIVTEVNSKVPKPKGIGPVVATIAAITELGNTTKKDA